MGSHLEIWIAATEEVGTGSVVYSENDNKVESIGGGVVSR